MTEERSAEAGLWAMADLMTPMALRVAATLRVADHIAGGLDTAPELADAVQADTEALDRLLLHLVSVEVLTRDRSGRYALAPRGESLRDDHPSGTRALIDSESAIGRADLSFVHLLHSVRTGEAAFPLQFGRGFWEDLDSEPGLRASYDEQMGADVAAWAPHILAAYDWGSLDHVVDVGGGNGTLLAALLSANPRLRGTLFDQPRTAEAARRTLTAAGLDARSDVLSGSFFDRLPPGAGGYVLCAILHDWDDEAADAILRRCAEAAGTGGTVFVVEKTGADGESPSTGMDLRMLAYFGGRERRVAELRSLALGAGLDVAAVHPAGELAILELTGARCDDAPSRTCDRGLMTSNHPTVWPILSYRDARAALAFLSEAFGFEERAAHARDDDPSIIDHAEMRWPLGGGIMFGSAGKDDSPFGQRAPGNDAVYVVCEDPDSLFERAVAAGAVVVRGLTDQDYGSRDFTVRDPEGNLWSFGTYVGE